MERVQQQFTIEQPRLEDAEEVAAMHGQSWIDTYLGEGVPKEINDLVKQRAAYISSVEGAEKRRELIRNTIDDPTHFFWRVARTQDRKIVGFVDGKKQEEKQELLGLYVDKKFHGTGIASDLARTFLEWADKDKPIELEVVSYNDRAIAFYEKIGFEEIPGSEGFYREILPTIRMKHEAKEK